MTTTQNKITATLIEHSINDRDEEILSIETIAPYRIDNEIEKHGMIETNSSSSRAIPTKKLLDQLYIPPDIRYNEKGMQGFTPLSDEHREQFEAFIANSHKYIVTGLDHFDTDVKVHKQHINWYLIPYIMQKKILTANKSSFLDMLRLRNHTDALPDIQIWARAIEEVIQNANSPYARNKGEWHLPYILEHERENIDIQDLLKISSARCARTSYLSNVTNKVSTIEEDIQLYNRLAVMKPEHATPLCHQCTPFEETFTGQPPKLWPRGATLVNKFGNFGSGRLRGWAQFRHWRLD